MKIILKLDSRESDIVLLDIIIVISINYDFMCD